MPKLGKHERLREADEPIPDVDTSCLAVAYLLQITSFQMNLIGFKDQAGREFDLIIDHPLLADAAIPRLQALGVGRVASNGS